MTRYNPSKSEAERNFPHRVDIHVPAGGLGNRLNQMLAWCVMNFRAEDWDQHGASIKEPGKIPMSYAHFYFATSEDADLFRWTWVTP